MEHESAPASFLASRTQQKSLANVSVSPSGGSDGITDEQLLHELAYEHEQIESFRRETLIMMLSVVGQMRTVQVRIRSEYGMSALFEDDFNAETATSYLAKSAANLMRAMRCIEWKSRRNHVEPFDPERE